MRAPHLRFVWRAPMGALAVVVGMIACSGIITGPDAGPDTSPRRMSVSPARLELSLTDTARMTANLFDVTGAAAVLDPATPIRFRSGDSTIARVDATGLVTAIADGTTTVTASYGALQLGIPVVVLGRPRLLVVSGNAQTAEQGDTLPLPIVVRALDAGGAAIAGASVTFAVTSGNGTLAAVQGVTDGSGLASARWVLGLPLGAQRVLVTSAGLDSAAFTATATAGTRAARIVLQPLDTTLVGTGIPVQLAASVRNVADAVLPAAPITWVSTVPAVATVSPTGLVTSVAPGVTFVRATSGTVSDSTRVTVLALPVITVAPTTVALTTPAGSSPAATTIAVTNSGDSRLSGLGASVVYGAGATGWLALAFDSTAAPATLSLTPSTASVPVGSYTATVTIASSVAGVVARSVPVTLDVTSVGPLPKLQLGNDLFHPIGLQAERRGDLPVPATAPLVVTLRSIDEAQLILALDGETSGSGTITIALGAGQQTFAYWMQGVADGFPHARVVAEAPGYEPDTIEVVLSAPAVQLTLITPNPVPATGGPEPVLQVTVGYNDEGRVVPMAVRAFGPAPAFSVASAFPDFAQMRFRATAATNGTDQGPATSVSFELRPGRSATSLPDVSLALPASLSVVLAGRGGEVNFSVTGPPEYIVLGGDPVLTVSEPPVLSLGVDTLQAAWLQSQRQVTIPSTVFDPVDVTIRSLDPSAVRVASSPSAVGTAQIITQVEGGTTNAVYWLSGVPGASGRTALVVAEAAGYAPDTMLVTVTRPAYTLTRDNTGALPASGGEDPVFVLTVGENLGEGTLIPMAVSPGTTPPDFTLRADQPSIAGVQFFASAVVVGADQGPANTVTFALQSGQNSTSTGQFVGTPASLRAARTGLGGDAVISMDAAPAEFDGLQRSVFFFFTAPAVPAIAVAPVSLTFNALAGGANPAPQSIAITNGGSGTLTGLSTDSQIDGGAIDWVLSLSLSDVNAPSTLDVSLFMDGTLPGTYTATITISSSVPGVLPVDVPVTLVVGAAPPPPKLDLGPDRTHPALLQDERLVTLPATIVDPVMVTIRSLTPGAMLISSRQYEAGARVDSVQVEGGTAEALYWIQALDGSAGRTAMVIAEAPGYLPDTMVVTMTTPSFRLAFGGLSSLPAAGGADPVMLLSVGDVIGGTFVPLAVSVGAEPPLFTLTSRAPAVAQVRFVAGPGVTGADQGPADQVTFGIAGGTNTTASGAFIGSPANLVLARTGTAGLVQVDAAAVAVGDFSGFATGVQYTLTAPVVPIIVALPDSIAFTEPTLTVTPASQQVAITNAGAGTLTGLATEILYGAGASDWLAVAFDSTTAPATMTVTASAEFLAIGTYTATIGITSTVPGVAPRVLPVSFVVTDVARIEIVSGDGQSVEWGEFAPDSLKVRVLRADGMPLGDAFVQFTVSANGGTLSPESDVTDNDGYVATRWRMSTDLGTYTVTASRNGYRSAVFTGTSVGGTYVTRVQVTALNTALTVGAAAEQFTAAAYNLADSLIASATIDWASRTPTVATVDPTGLVTAVAAGQSWIVASSGDGSDSVLVTVTAPVVGLVKVSGDLQSATVGTPLAAPMVVRITDSGGNPVVGARLEWAARYGCCNPIETVNDTTDADGVARYTPTMPTIALPVTVDVTSTGAPGSPQSFTATPVPEPATYLAFALNTGGGTAGRTLSPGWSIHARDRFANVDVNFSGPITVVLFNGPTAIATLSGTTTRNAVNGVADFNDLSVNVPNSSWVLNASSPGLAGAQSAAFSIGIAARMTLLNTPLVPLGGTATLRVETSVPSYGTGLVVALSPNSAGIVSVNEPASVTLPVGDSIVDFTLTGVSSGFMFLNATVDGNGAGQLGVTVSSDAVTLPPTLVAPYTRTTSLPISIAQPAPAGGTSIAVVSADPSIVNVTTPTVLIPEGATTANAQLDGVALGQTTVTATGAGLATGTSVVTVTASLDLLETDLTIGTASVATLTTQLLSGGSVFPAPASGIALTFLTRDAACVAAPAASSVPAGLGSITATAAYGGSAPLPCSTYVVATSPGFDPDSALITVQPPSPIIGVAPDSLGFTAVEGSTSGTPQTVTVSNIGGGTLSGLEATVLFPAGSSDWLFASLDANMPATLTVTPQPEFLTAGNYRAIIEIISALPGVAPETVVVTMTVTAPVTTIALDIAGEDLVGVGLSTTLDVTLGSPAGAGGVTVTVTSDNASMVGVAAPGTVTIGAGQSTGQIALNGLSVGTTTVRANAVGYTEGTLAVAATNQIISLPTTLNVPYGLTTSIPVQLATPAPAGGVTVTLVSSDPGNVAVATGTVTLPQGATLASGTLSGVTPGAATITATATGWVSDATTATTTAQLNVVESSLGINTTFGSAITIELRSGASAISAPAPGVTVALTAINAACVAVPATVTIPTGQTTVTAAVTYGGSSVTPCASFVRATATNMLPDSLNVSVAAPPGITVSNATLGAGLQAGWSSTLGATNFGTTTVRVESSDPTRLLIAPNASTVGSAFLDIPLTAPSTSAGYVLQVIEGATGSATITTTAPGFVSATATVTFRGLGVDFLSVPPTTTSLSPNQLLQVRIGQLDASGTSIEAEYALRTGGVPRTATITNSNAAAAQLVTTALTGQSVTAPIIVGQTRTPSSLASGGFEFDPLSSGSTTVSVSIPGVTSLAGATRPVTISAPVITTGNATLGAGLQAGWSSTLGATNFGTTTVRVESSDPTRLLIAPNASTVGSAFLDIPLTAPSTSAGYVLQVLESATGSATITTTAPGFVSATATVTFRGLGVDFLSVPPTTTSLSPNQLLQVRIGQLDASGTSIEAEFALRTGGVPRTATITNSNAAAAQLVTTALTGQSVTAPIIVGQTRTPSSLASGGFEFDPLASGSTTVSVSIPGVTSLAGATRPVTISAPVITTGNATLGAGLQAGWSSTLGATNFGTTTVRVESSDPTRLLIAPNASTVGSAFLDIPLTAPSTSAGYVLQVLESATGSATITTTAPGFVSATATVTFRGLGVDFLSVPPTTTSLSPNQLLQVRIGQLDASGTSIEAEFALRTGGVPRTATITNSNATAAQLVTAALTGQSVTAPIIVGQTRTPSSLATGGFEFDPLSSGSTTVSVSIPGVTSLAGASRSVVISAPGITVGAVTIGAGTQAGSSAGLGATNFGSTTMRIESSNPALFLIAPNASTVGSAFLDVPLTAPNTSASYVVQALEGVTGTGTITVSAPGFTSANATVTVRGLGVDFLSVPTSIAAGATDLLLQARIGTLNAAGTAIESEYALRFGGVPLTATITSSNGAAAQLVTTAFTGASVTAGIAIGQTRTASAVATGGFALDPLAGGTTTVSVSIPGVTSVPGAARTVTVTP